MSGPTRFQFFCDPRSIAFPIAVHLQSGAGNSAVSLQLFFACFIFSWGRDFREARS